MTFEFDRTIVESIANRQAAPMVREMKAEV